MKKAVVLTKKSAALLLGGVMSLSCMAGAFGIAFNGRSVAKAAGGVVSVDTHVQYQQFDGWGTSLAWWANEIGDWTRPSADGTTQREYIMKLLFSEEGLNWNIARYNIGGGDDPSHEHLAFDTAVPGWKDSADSLYTYENEDGSIKPWTETADARQLWVLKTFQEMRKDIAEGKGETSDAITEFFSNSPPYYMTQNGCASGKGKSTNLKDVDAYIEYFLDVYKYMIDQGFDIDLLQPFNESSTNGEGWGAADGNTGDQEGCAISVAQKITVLTAIKNRIEELAAIDPKYAAGYNLGDEVDTGRANNELDYISGASGGNAVISNASKLTYHIYGYKIPEAQKIYRRAKANGSKAEMSEITWTVSGTYDPNSMDTALQKYSQSIIDIVKYGAAESYVFWQGMENLSGLIKTGWNYGLLHGVYDNPERPSTVSGYDLASRGLVYQDVRTCKSYFVAGQYSKYIQPGYTIVDCSDSRGIAAISPDGQTLVIVKENNGGSSATVDINLKNFNATSIEKIYTDETHNWAHETISGSATRFSDELSPYSVSTYVIKGSSLTGQTHILDESGAKNFSYNTNHTNDFKNMHEAIVEAGNKEQLYTAGSWSSDVKENNFAGATVYNSSSHDCYVAATFYGTGFALLGIRKSDSSSFDYWVDPTISGDALPAAVSGQHVDSAYATGELYKQILVRKNDLTEGWHTVYVKIPRNSGWMNLDGVMVINGQDTPAGTSYAPEITSAVAKDHTLSVAWEGVASADHYQVKYRTRGSSSWDSMNAANTHADVMDLPGAAGTQYEVCVVAVDSSNNPIRTNEAECTSGVSIVTMNITPDGLMYFVDVGTTSLSDGGWGRAYGKYNSTFDMAKGTDPATGKTWGYTKGAKTGWEGEDTFSSIRHSGETAYSFWLPAGSYTLTVGGFVPSKWGNRTCNIKVTGTGSATGSFQMKNDIATIGHVNFTTSSDGEVNVSLTNGGGGDPCTSLIVITESGKSIPILANGKSNYTMTGKYDHSGITQNGEVYLGSNLSALDTSVEIKVIMSDESELTMKVTDGDLEYIESYLTKAAAGEYYSIKYRTKGSQWDASWPEMQVLPTYLIKEKAVVIQEYEVKVPEVVYYYIDAGTDGTYWNSHDFAEVKGTVQTGNNADQKYDGSNGWGFVDKRAINQGINWKDDNPNASIREIGDNDGTYVGGYVMTGFTANQSFTLEIGMDCKNWGDRSADVMIGGTVAADNESITGGTKIGAVNMTNGVLAVEKYEVQADADGKLIVSFPIASGQAPQLSYIKAYTPGVYQEEILETLPTLDPVKVSQTAYFRDSFVSGQEPAVEIKNLKAGATVYIIDSEDRLVDSFVATGATASWSNWSKVKSDAYALRISQAEVGCVNGSTETEIALPRIEVSYDSTKVVKAGDKAVIMITPKLGSLPKDVYGSIDSIVVKRPVDPAENIYVTADVISAFFYRTATNGEHLIIVKCNGVEYTTTVNVTSVDTLDVDAVWSTTGWTSGSVTITVTPTSKSGIDKVYVDDVETALSSGSCTVTATENGEHKVKVVTNAGSEKEYVYNVTNIDKGNATLSMSINFSVSGGVQFNYTGTSQSAGTLTVKKDGGEAQNVSSIGAFTAMEAGKYEFKYVSATGQESETYTYYVTTDKAQARLATVSVAPDGTVTVVGKVEGSNVTSKLYRAGKDQVLSSLNVANAGKYYLELTKDGESEIVVIDTAQNSNTNNIIEPAPAKPAKNNNGNTVNIALTVVFAVLAAAAVAGVVVVVLKGRKAQ